MFNPTDFYSGFQINHFKYKQLTSKYLLGLPDTELEKLMDGITEGDVRDLRLSLQIDIRLNFLFSIETLFELIFGLLPDEKNIVDDSLLLFRLAEKKQHYDQIRRFGNMEDSRLVKLDETYKLPNGIMAPFAWHVFYNGIGGQFAIESVLSSLSVIKEYLITFAKELSNREELNSYKHGFRGISMLKRIAFAKPETMEEMFSFDLANSITIFSRDKKTDIHKYETKNFDTERDIALTYITSDILSNIIRPRKAQFSKTVSKMVEISFFDEETRESSTKYNIEMTTLTHTMTPEGKATDK